MSLTMTKYQQLKSSASAKEFKSRRNSEIATCSFPRIHWSLKLLLAFVVILQLLYFGYISNMNVCYFNSTSGTCENPLDEYFPEDFISEREYFINTSSCHIPYVYPFTKKVRKIFKPSRTTGCTNDEPIIDVAYNDETDQYSLHINYTVAETFVPNRNELTIIEDLLCCYRRIERGDILGDRADFKYTLSPCTIFGQDFLVPKHIQGIITNCISKSMRRLLQQDAFSFIQVQESKGIIGDKTAQQTGVNGSRKVGVLFLGIDSMSRINVRRNMPETIKYLETKGWFELEGYNKVGDNTLPNLMPMLSGYTESTTYDKCKPSIVGSLDHCNFMWTNFKEHGFKTAYAEDTTDYSTFNYDMPGFLNPPTDHYFRPIALAIERTMKAVQKDGLNYCIGRRQFGEYIYDYGLEFATRYQNQSNFGFFWTNSFSHNSFSTAATMDRTISNYLRELESRGILDTSVVVLFSDHGRRWGPLLDLPEGYLEERLPMFFLSVPSWFSEDYKANLRQNQKRLVTPFDIHMTLQHMLHMAAPQFSITPAYSCPKAESIFHEISENRTCEDACIPEAWCTCVSYTDISVDNVIVTKVAELIVNEMNLYFFAKNITSLCSELTLQTISHAKLRDQTMSRDNNISTYTIEFITNPKTDPDTVFRATADYDAQLDKIEVNVGDIGRHSLYKSTAQCIEDKQAKKYCICKDYFNEAR